MFDSITFSVGKRTIILHSQEFTLGDISLQILNLTYCEIRRMLETLNQAKALSRQYEATEDFSFWFQANELYLQVEMELQRHSLFSLLMPNSSMLLKATVLRTEDWPSYKIYFNKINTLLNDISLFHTVIIDFIVRLIMPMESLTQSNINEAVHWLTEYHYPIYYPEEKRGIGYPYHFNKPITLSFHSREIAPETGEYEIIETYTTEELLMLLKIDFYKALEAGHLLRQCEYCGRFFLLTKRLHTKYCDNPAPDNPKYTCAQMGYRQSHRKEQPEDDPKADSLRRCLNRIAQDCSRKRITPEERDLLKAKANELYHQVKIRSGVTYEEFEKSLASENLYPLCNVSKKSNPVGRPKTEKAG